MKKANPDLLLARIVARRDKIWDRRPAPKAPRRPTRHARSSEPCRVPGGEGEVACRGPFLAVIVSRPIVLPLLALALAACDGQRLERIHGSGHVIDLSLKAKKLEAELAADHSSRERGLMHRTELPPDRGMLFLWPGHGEEGSVERRKFWMRNTSIPLSIAFIDDEGKILQIEDMRPYDERGILSKDEVRFALEMNQGWFERNGIKPGDSFEDFRKKVGGIEAR